jgi:cobaltochelatase CobS
MKEIGRKSLEEVFGLSELKSAATRVFEPGPLTPPIDPHYEFTPELARLLMLWESGITKKKGLLISGPTDCGKSSGIEQFAARTGRQVFRIGCHGKMEWQEVMGTLQFATDGSTFHVPGPVPCSMKAGGILIFEEINFLPPNTVGAANTLLDGGAVTVTETGEVIAPDRDFRVCATANAIDQGDDAVLYRGTQTMNKALLRRFLTSRAGYLEPQREAALLHRVAPRLPGALIGRLIEAVGDIRKQFLSGDLETVLGHSYMCDLARLMEMRLPKLLDGNKHVVNEELSFLMRFNGLDAAPLDDANAIFEVVKSKLTGQAFVAVAGPVPVTPQPSPAKTSRSQKVAPANRLSTLHFLVNPARSGTGQTPTVAFWAMIEAPGAATAASWNGTLVPTATTRQTQAKAISSVRATRTEKSSKKGYMLEKSVFTAATEVDVVVKSVVEALSSILGGSTHQTTRLDVHELVTGILSEWGIQNFTQKALAAGVPVSAQLGTLN